MTHFDFEENFYGRRDILELLKKRVVNLKEGSRQNVALLGNLHVGKSFILQNFIRNYDDDDVIFIYLDLDHKDFNHFFTKFTSSLLYNYLKAKGHALHEELPLLIETAAPVLPQTVQVIRKIQSDFKSGRNYETFLGLLTLPEIFTNESGKFCVLILDEFQNLETCLSPRVYQDLGKKIMTQKKSFYILTSSHQKLARKILSEKLSLLFGNFEVVEIETFDLQSSQHFIDFCLKDRKIGAQLRNFLIDFTGGHPLYLSLICQELLNLSGIHNQNEIYLPLLAQAVENTIFNRWGVISRHFDLLLNDIFSGKGNRVISSLLISLSNGKNKIEEISKDLNLKPATVKPKLNRLFEMNVVVKNGYFYYFKDKLFRHWVKYVYQRRLKNLVHSLEVQRRQFREEFNRIVESFKVSSRKDFSSRIIELLHCFDNESYDLNGRKYKLPLFGEITPFKIKNDTGVYFDVIKASDSNSTWLICLGNESFGENDLSALLGEAKKMGLKSQKGLLISLNRLDQNTRLKALQEKFWIWNEGELNSILTLFDKPYILR